MNMESQPGTWTSSITGPVSDVSSHRVVPGEQLTFTQEIDTDIAGDGVQGELSFRHAGGETSFEPVRADIPGGGYVELTWDQQLALATWTAYLPDGGQYEVTYESETEPSMGVYGIETPEGEIRVSWVNQAPEQIGVAYVDRGASVVTPVDPPSFSPLHFSPVTAMMNGVPLKSGSILRAADSGTLVASVTAEFSEYATGTQFQDQPFNLGSAHFELQQVSD